jgi:hypothetical protein
MLITVCRGVYDFLMNLPTTVFHFSGNDLLERADRFISDKSLRWCFERLGSATRLVKGQEFDARWLDESERYHTTKTGLAWSDSERLTEERTIYWMNENTRSLLSMAFRLDSVCLLNALERESPATDRDSDGRPILANSELDLNFLTKVWNTMCTILPFRSPLRGTDIFGHVRIHCGTKPVYG